MPAVIRQTDAHRIAVLASPKTKIPARERAHGPDPGPRGIGGSHGDLALGEQEEEAADRHAGNGKDDPQHALQESTPPSFRPIGQPISHKPARIR